jgi:predicted phage terminase large subunit-like protein
VQRSKDKYTRVSDILGYIESGYVSLPIDSPFICDFVAECEAFTADDSHAHDDQIDPMCDAITEMLQSNGLRAWENMI